MAWGGPPAGGPWGGPTAGAASAAAGLPFAGVPPELAPRVQAILDHEPVHPEPTVAFTHVMDDRRPFTLRRFLGTERAGIALAFLLVVVETLAVQAGPLLTQVAIDKGIDARDVRVLAVLAAVFAATVALGMVVGGLRVSWTARVGEKLLYRLRIRVFTHLQRQSVDYFTAEKGGRVMTRMTSDIDALSALFQDGIVNLAVQGLTMLVVTVILFLLNPFLAVLTVLVVVPAMTVLSLWFRSASDRGYLAVRERIADVLADLQETLSGIRVIAATNRRRHNVVHHRNVLGDYRRANVHTARIGALYGPASDLVGVAGQAVVLGVGGTMVLQGRLSLGELTAFVLYLAAFFAPIQQLVQLYTTYQSGQAAVVKLRELLAAEPTVEERPGALDLPPIEGRIEFDDVSFSYAPRARSEPAGDGGGGGRDPDGEAVLRHVTLVVEPGETIAFVGPTGAGKSTLAKLVTRFHDPTEGRVLVDGIDLRDVTLASLRLQLGVVPQEPFLFAGTLRDNVAFARPDADEAEVLAACHAVGLDDLLAQLPAGLDTPVHERGASLSSGERQLLALARAFLARPRVLVLDEATSNLDPRSEGRVERAFDAVREGRTAIVIAHRLATAARADRIAVIDEGRLVEVGHHDELLAAGGRYADMYATWSAHLGGPAADRPG
ncbi:MAG: ABC transporter ATP-binding protein [Acidimicrobiales bacterium]|nr:ABC transporter ATP-binding protein [Acidimicrobiales bacterium]